MFIKLYIYIYIPYSLFRIFIFLQEFIGKFPWYLPSQIIYREIDKRKQIELSILNKNMFPEEYKQGKKYIIILESKRF